MTPTLIFLVFAVIAVAVVVWIVRRKPTNRPYEARTDQDTAWNDPLSSTDAAPKDGDKLP